MDKSNNFTVKSNKDTKVLEMTKDICSFKVVCNDVCNPLDSCAAYRYAERAVEAGYVKQREGEWIKRPYAYMEFRYECSLCQEGTDLQSPFCPNCGAKMKGGAE